ncbi:beta-N-acetylhexosaminidase [Paramicrobacterium fandaimingii]|uniref:beta-N-acetylhexosaminidase n=1 Tax=Paramicrobacterium fandaimingii TaxID=2708079 RepID=UPI001C3FA39D|nr:family 20 glycosylhydrolase [Microbacterium fandaimingii]
MLDVARHFHPIEYLYRFADLLALHKANVMHLHLTDDQGWRMPVGAYPRLTEIGGYRSETSGDGIRHGGAYTRRELTDFVAYAASRGVTVVPEIEMPGHARAALAAYPELGNRPEHRLDVWTQWGVCTNIFGVHDEVLEFCRTVLDEVMDVFPSQYIHLGGDESPLDEWEQSPRAAARIREKNLRGSRDLYRWFMGEAAEHVARAGRRALAWAEDELTLPSTVTVMPWRDVAHGRAAIDRGHDVVMAPHLETYLDYAETTDAGEPTAHQEGVILLPLRTAQSFSAVPAAWEASAAEHVLGMQAQLWTEYLPTRELVEYRAFPRFSALADAAWGGVDEWDAFAPRLAHHRLRLDALGVPRSVKRVGAGDTGLSVGRTGSS